MKVISTFRHPVSLSVSNMAVNEFNEYHTGQKYFPLDKPVPPTKSGADLKNLHHRLFAGTGTEVVVELLEDGSLRIKKDQSNETL